jgi:ketosteroid isomerase-like protein
VSSNWNSSDTACRGFFERYAEASQKKDPGALAEMYAPSFIVGGPQGSVSVANDMRFLAWLEQVYDFNQKHGMRSLEVVSVDGITLSPLHSMATVKWGARFAKTADRLIEFQISYLLEKAGNGWKILSYISQADQENEMKKLGLL